MKPKLIVALDTEAQNVDKILEKLGNDQEWYKVGYKLFLTEGTAILDKLKGLNKNVFLDLKFCDIPNTMVNAALNVCSMNVDMFNVHVSAGKAALIAVRKAIDDWATRNGARAPLYIGVTVLTSLVAEVDTVVEMASLAKKCGLDGVVCSVWEVPKIKDCCGSDFLCICPGIRFDRDDRNDQQRIATIEDAQRCGADFIVMGRSIIKNFV